MNVYFLSFRFCLVDDADETQNSLRNYFPASDCTQWDGLKYDRLTERNSPFIRNLVFQDLSNSCFGDINSVMRELFELSEDRPRVGGNVCSTNCVLGVSGGTESSSVLLLEDIDVIQADKVIRLSGNDNNLECSMQLQCCFDSVPEACFECKLTLHT